MIIVMKKYLIIYYIILFSVLQVVNALFVNRNHKKVMKLQLIAHNE